MDKKQYKLDTLMNHVGEDLNKEHGAVNPPIYQSSVFARSTYEDIEAYFEGAKEGYLYSRTKNPTNDVLEAKLAMLANAEASITFGSGMGAISSAILSCIKNGDHIIASNNLYNPTMNFITKELKEKCNIESTIVEGDKIEDFENNIKENTTLIYLECPSTAVFKMQDIKAIAKLAKKHNIKTIIDNTWATPLYQRCIEMGIDLEVHSLSKYLNGHSDVVGGCIIGSKEDIEGIRNSELALYGAKLAPFEVFLVIRGLRSLHARLAVHTKNAKEVVNFLDNHPKVTKVFHPLSKYFAQKELAEKQLLNCTALLSFEIDAKDTSDVKKFINELNLFKIGVSWGGHESLVFAPNIAILNEMTLEQAKSLNVSPYTIRISLGLENAEDLINDLNDALEIL